MFMTVCNEINVAPVHILWQERAELAHLINMSSRIGAPEGMYGDMLHGNVLLMECSMMYLYFT